MKKKILSLVLLLISILPFVSCKTNNEKEDIGYIDSLIRDTTMYIPAWNKESYKGKWNYIDGVFLNSIVTLYNDLKDTDIDKANYYKDFFIKYINYYVDKDGDFVNLKDYTPGYKSGELDTVCASKVLFDAYEITNDDRYLKAIENTYEELMNQPRVAGSNNFSHKVEYLNQIWLDGMYMYAPFYARYAVAHNNDSILSEIKGHYEYIRNHMFNEEKNLYYHGYDSTKAIFWADNITGCSKSFWLRSMGWYLVSLCDILEYYPDGEEKKYLNDLLVEGLEGILQYQDQESKMFYQVIDLGNKEVNVSAYYLQNLKNTRYTVGGNYVDSKITNYLESSGSSMIAYALMKSARLGYIAEEYKQIGSDIFKGIYNHSFKNNELNNICITAGLGPDSKQYRDGSVEYYLAEPVGSNDAKGVGPFIMAYLEYDGDDISM